MKLSSALLALEVTLDISSKMYTPAAGWGTQMLVQFLRGNLDSCNFTLQLFQATFVARNACIASLKKLLTTHIINHCLWL